MKPILKAISISSKSQAHFARLINASLNLSGADCVTTAQVWNWVNRDNEVPIQYCPTIEKLCDERVTRRDLRQHDWKQIWPEYAEKMKITRARKKTASEMRREVDLGYRQPADPKGINK